MNTATLTSVPLSKKILGFLAAIRAAISDPMFNWVALLILLFLSPSFTGVNGHAVGWVGLLTGFAVVISAIFCLAVSLTKSRTYTSKILRFTEDKPGRAMSILFLIILFVQSPLHYVHNIQWMRDDSYALRIDGKGITDTELHFANAFTQEITRIEKTYTLSFAVRGVTKEGANIEADVYIDLKYGANPNQWRSKSEIEKDGIVAEAIQKKFATATKTLSISSVGTAQLELAFALTDKTIPLPPVVRWNGKIAVSNISTVAYTD